MSDDLERQIDWDLAVWRADARRDDERRAKKAREHEYGRAKAAAEAWLQDLDRKLDRLSWSQSLQVRAGISPQVERLQRHVVDLAAQEPAIQLIWLSPGARSVELVGRGNSVAILNKHATVCEPVCDVASHATVTHEIAHLRDPNVRTSSRLARELFAWSWARKHCLAWDAAAQAAMVAALQTYIDSSPKRDLLEVIEAEEFIRPIHFRAEQVRRWKGELT
jgi:hypothetical protein